MSQLNNVTDASVHIDEALVPLRDLVEGLVIEGGQIEDEQLGVSMSIESIKLDLPVELDIFTDDNGQVIIGGAPPTQHTETSIMPVFHQLKMTVVHVAASHHETNDFNQKFLQGGPGGAVFSKSAPPGRRRQRR
jgi:hypothetical protein